MKRPVWKNIYILSVFVALLLLATTQAADAFVVSYEVSYYDPPGFFSGIWHGLLAPYSLIARWFIDGAVMYAMPNSGWFYDLGFLLGTAGSLPIGWAAAIISAIAHLIS